MPDIVFSPHALYEMKRRDLSMKIVRAVVEKPGQSWEIREGRMVFQSRSDPETAGRIYLVRVFVDTWRKPPEVVTAYKTSKVEKYWRSDL
jgi:hypothetical protein